MSNLSNFMLSPLVLADQVDIPTTPSTECWKLIQLYLKLGRFNQSLQVAYALVQRDPGQLQAYNNHQLSLLRLGAEFAEEVENFHQAAYYWEQITKQQPQDADAWYGLGLARANLGSSYLPGAETALIQALKLNPNNPRIQQNLANIQSILRQ
jgi:Flp pilus assembly protein TadD